MTPLSSGTYLFVQGPKTCAAQLDVTVSASYRNGEDEVTVNDPATNTKTTLVKWPGHPAATGFGGVSLTPVQAGLPSYGVDAWVAFESNEANCTYRIELRLR